MAVVALKAIKMTEELRGYLLEFLSPLRLSLMLSIVFLCLLLLVSNKSTEKNGRVSEWNGLSKYYPSTFHVQHADVWQFVQETWKGWVF